MLIILYIYLLILYLFLIIKYLFLINFYNQFLYFFQQVFIKKLFLLIKIKIHNLIKYHIVS